MPAGPSEVAVIADETAVSQFVAADLLSQAEHGSDSQVVLICTSNTKIREIENELNEALKVLPRKEIASKALENSFVIKVSDVSQGVDVANQYAPEHLILAVDEPELVVEQIVNAGSVFLGHFTPESAGDYASGTNHTLPTNGAARAFSGVNMDAFYKKITFQQLSSVGVVSIGNAVVTMAQNEQLKAHANAMQVRLDFLERKQQS
ncbi:MAG: histidinol dehydrogenase, partial [Salinivirgaceae bacterium]